MANAKEVARLLVHLAANESEPDYLTNLRLQKLLYYAQAWSLVMRKKPIFSQSIEAWVHGPVVREVYAQYADNGDRVISPDGIDATKIKLTPEERSFVGSVWESYKGYSASKLREMTHQEEPWINARNGYGPADSCEVVIAHKAMRDYFQDAPSE
jgi:uncharacterized phage-associated protein